MCTCGPGLGSAPVPVRGRRGAAMPLGLPGDKSAVQARTAGLLLTLSSLLRRSAVRLLVS